jgi:hypothetical protein
MKNLALMLALLALLPACERMTQKNEACPPVEATVEVEEEIDIEEDGDDTADTEEESDEESDEDARKKCEPVPGCASCCK